MKESRQVIGYPAFELVRYDLDRVRVPRSKRSFLNLSTDVFGLQLRSLEAVKAEAKRSPKGCLYRLDERPRMELEEMAGALNCPFPLPWKMGGSRPWPGSGAVEVGNGLEN